MYISGQRTCFTLSVIETIYKVKHIQKYDKICLEILRKIWREQQLFL